MAKIKELIINYRRNVIILFIIVFILIAAIVYIQYKNAINYEKRSRGQEFYCTQLTKGMTKEEVIVMLNIRGGIRQRIVDDSNEYELIRINYQDQDTDDIFGRIYLEIIDGKLDDIIESGGWDVFYDYCRDYQK